ARRRRYRSHPHRAHPRAARGMVRRGRGASESGEPVEPACCHALRRPTHESGGCCTRGWVGVWVTAPGRVFGGRGGAGGVSGRCGAERSPIGGEVVLPVRCVGGTFLGSDGIAGCL